MPIEVRELVIKATITQDGQQGNAASAGNNNAVTSPEEIINTCVEKVLDILKDKMER
jgi:Family of unknown function (DUF5908)